MLTHYSALHATTFVGTLLAATSTLLRVYAVPATSTITLFDVPIPSDSNEPQPPSVPTPSISFSLIGTTTRDDGAVMTLYGEDIVNSEFVEGETTSVASGTQSAEWTWSTVTVSDPVTLHEVYGLGASVIEYSHSPTSTDDVGFAVECQIFSSGESAGTGVCTELYQANVGSPSTSTAWTGSVVPYATFTISDSDSATNSTSSGSSNGAGSLKSYETITSSLVGVCFAALVSTIVALVPF
ncbi:hypothetical protein EV361DRAFT_667474 [Lentinula raphanica]|uniref:Uncharacterized protein n=1 Tax=Lentinula raphanica TaxID=153919 RepID=A0AA38PGN1_9AGAR|nr:hypothetical protein EV360DRAFT_80344 [Lentinula raphanica]KAJ3823301.1 hypothetical protein F5880DRAFT_542741 [Lentinula raphanica]KAJ3842554.1 hypothetical protein F5878DRAFT_383671 [Lentinula raphanica]KAJ3974211.1 hypothetical protein EV361DRAFT_667474 [Lentinula raphanica]